MKRPSSFKKRRHKCDNNLSNICWRPVAAATISHYSSSSNNNCWPTTNLSPLSSRMVVRRWHSRRPPLGNRISSMTKFLMEFLKNLVFLRYYDAASDGYFYEMASVDGWRRRRGASPTSSNKGGQKPPPSIQQQHQQQISGGIASQLLMGAPHQQQMKPPSLPLQFQSYIGGQHQQPSHQLTPAELNEILMKHSQNLPFRFAPGQEKVQPPVLPPCCAPSVVAPTSIPPPQPSSAVSANNCCCCQMAVAAHMLMHDRMQQLQLMTTDPATAATMNNINNKCCNCTSPAESGNSSSTTTYNKNLNLTMNGSNNTSTTPFSASSEAKSSASPPPLLHSITGQQPLEGSNNIIIKDQRRHNSVSHIDKWKKSGDGGRDSRFQQGGFSQPFTSAFLDGRPIDIALGRKQPQKMLPSSFEEPYEFYWVFILC